MQVANRMFGRIRLPATRLAAGGALPFQWRSFSTEAKSEMKTETQHVANLTRTYSGFEQDGGRTSLWIQVDDRPGSLQEVVTLFGKNQVNMTHIESRPSKNTKAGTSVVDIFVDLEATDNDPVVHNLVEQLQAVCPKVDLLGPRSVPWFPRRITDLDSFSQKTLDAGAELESDHPGFNDIEYRKRRAAIVAAAGDYKYGKEIPRVEYTAEETEAWGAVWRKLHNLYPEFACSQFQNIMPLLQQNCGYGENNIPQLQDISIFLKESTGFQLRPVAGLLTARDFLNALAFRTFFSTQYIRHHSEPFYTPEPDVCHELMGHVPMLADQDFADFSHEIGLASLGASDADIKRLASCYWFSVEFGLCKEGDSIRAYGAGLLSSFGELEYSCAPYRPAGGTEERPNLRAWDPIEASTLEYPITTYQPNLFVADSLADAKTKMINFCEEEVNRPFYVSYDSLTESVKVDRAVKRGDYRVTLQT